MSMEDEQIENRNKRKLDIDWEQVLPERNDDPPAELIVMKDEPPKSSSDDSASGEENEFKNFSDMELEQQLKRMERFYACQRSTLPDKGEKLYRRLKVLEQERERRRLHGPDTSCSGVAGYEKEKNVTSGALNAFKQGNASSQHQARSFGSAFREKMDKSKNCRAFDKELSIVAPCERRKTKSIEELSYSKGQHPRLSSRQLPFKCAVKLSSEEDESAFPSRYEEDISNNHQKKDEFPVPHTNKTRRKKNQTLVLIDEDELPPECTAEETQHADLTDQEDKLDECMKDARIYYPSRDDPESVEICYTDLNNLDPRAYLTSPIMNFYIRYLQRRASPTNRAIYDCHFFNTYFYQKLKEAVSYKGNDKNSFFKFRRWWKGVNIFQKAYVLIPIHEDLHWSLVIISIPNKEEESGPIILHLDSLGLHSSRSVFDNIRSFLREEWNYMMENDSPSDLPISDRIWKHLPRRIDEKIITVPQQKNDYDCGLFVLYFMERFIEEAPERLKKANLAMFGKKWFRPEEASGLRARIRNILKREFELTKTGDCKAQSH